MLRQKLIFNFSSRFFLQFLQVGASIIVARVAGPTVLGTVAFGTAYVVTFDFLTNMGLGGAHLKLISEGQDEGKCLATYARLKIFTTSLFFMAVVIFFLSQKYLFGVKFESKIHQFVIFITLITYTIQSFVRIPVETFAAKIEIAKHTIPNTVRMVIYHILRIIVVLLGYKALTIAFCNLASMIIIIPIVLYFSRGMTLDKYDKELAKKYIKIAIPLIISSVAISLMASLDKVLLQFFTSSEYVGYYTAGYRFGSLLLIMAGTVGIFFPLFSKAISEGNKEYIRDKINKWERFVFLFIMPGVLFVCIYSDSIILFILGKKYINSITVFPIITIAMLVRVWTTPYGNVLTGSGFFVLVSKLEVINLILLIASLILFLHPQILGLKATGAALAIMASNIFSGSVFIYFAKKKLSILKKIKNLKFVLFGIINFFLFLFLYRYLIEYWGMTFRIIFPILYFSLTYSGLILLKWMRKDDLLLLKSIIDLKTMKKYIKGEIKSKS